MSPVPIEPICSPQCLVSPFTFVGCKRGQKKFPCRRACVFDVFEDESLIVRRFVADISVDYALPLDISYTIWIKGAQSDASRGERDT